MAQSISERKDRFSRLFPDRVEKVIKQFDLISNCSNKFNYEWDRDTVAKVWIHVLDAMKESADNYELNIDFSINGQSLSELAEGGSIESLFETTQPDSESPAPLF